MAPEITPVSKPKASAPMVATSTTPLMFFFLRPSWGPVPIVPASVTSVLMVIYVSSQVIVDVGGICTCKKWRVGNMWAELCGQPVDAAGCGTQSVGENTSMKVSSARSESPLAQASMATTPR